MSVIIVSWNGRDLVERCLTSFVNYVRTPHELIVVDNNSTDGTPAMISEKFPSVKLIRNSTNRGFSAANNQGAAEATAPVLFFLNSDTELLDDPLPILLTEVVSDENIGAVGPRLLNTDQSIQDSVRRFPSWSDQVMTLLKLRYLLRSTPTMKRYRDRTSQTALVPTTVDEVMGAAVLMRQTTFTRIGGWDEGYWIWFEDVDLCQRLRRANVSVRYVPAAQLIHHGGSSFGRVLSLKKQLWFMKSLFRYARKFWSPVSAYSLWIFFPVSYFLTGLQTLIKPR